MGSLKKTKILLKNGLTQSQLAENICTQATISNLENGSSVPTISILLKLAERLNIEFSNIYDYTLDNENKNNPNDSIYYFNQVLDSEVERSIDFIDVSATNGIGIAYDLQNESDKALTYFVRSLDQLDELFTMIDTLNESPEIAKIYYNTAKFYSKIGEYSKSMNLCNLGIRLLNNEGLSYYLDFLTYEKAFNLMKLEKKRNQ